MYIHLKGIPLLAWEPPPSVEPIYASEVMASPVVTFELVETVANIVHVLKTTTHNGFPVVDSTRFSNVSNC